MNSKEVGKAILEKMLTELINNKPLTLSPGDALMLTKHLGPEEVRKVTLCFLRDQFFKKFREGRDEKELVYELLVNYYESVFLNVLFSITLTLVDKQSLPFMADLAMMIDMDTYNKKPI